MKLTTPGGTPASSKSSKNLYAIAGASDEGFKTTVLPVTNDATVMPAMIASGKFQGGMTMPTPSGMYSSRLSSPSSRVSGCCAA
jgi:hypothetical protein